MSQAKKRRLDHLVFEQGLAPTRSKAQRLIMAGAVKVNGKIVDKPGTLIDPRTEISVIKDPCPYVSRGGLKLERALDQFSILVKGKSCMDVGASTGGFTHCLLKRGARRVVAIDVGYGQLDWSLRNDPRVTVVERTNFRLIDPKTFPYKEVDIIVIDVSFISLKLILPVAAALIKKNGIIIALIKPQFEVGPENLAKGGIVRDRGLQTQVVDEMKGFCHNELNFSILGVVESPILGAKGNREFLIALKEKGLSEDT